MTHSHIELKKSINTHKDENSSMLLSVEHSLKRWLSTDDLAVIYGISKSTQGKMRMASNKSTIPFVKLGSKYIRYDRIEIDKWLENHAVQGGN